MSDEFLLELAKLERAARAAVAARIAADCLGLAFEGLERASETGAGLANPDSPLAKYREAA
jgi:hypothetical protein